MHSFFAALLLIPMLFAQMMGVGGGTHIYTVVKTQAYTESFAYSTATDLVADAPTHWVYSASGSAFEVKSNLLYPWNVGPPATGNTVHPAFVSWIGSSVPANQYSIATFNQLGTVETGPSVRVSGTSGYAADCYSGGCKLIKMVSGTQSTLVAFGSAVANGSVVELDAVGTGPVKLTLIVNGTVYASFTDSNSPLTSGSPGYCNEFSSGDSGSTSTSVSNLKGGNF